MAAVFKNLVETGTNGSIKVQIFANGQLGKDNEVIQQVRDGIIESTISSASGVAQHYKLVGVFDLPFAFPNIAVVKTGLKTLGMLDSGGFFAISNSKRPIKTAADMAGLRLRTMTLPMHETTVKSLGGQPTPLPWAEVYPALQTGVADGQMNPIPIIAFAEFDEVQKYLSITNHVITPYFWFVNKKFYNGLSAEQSLFAGSDNLPGLGAVPGLPGSDPLLEALFTPAQISPLAAYNPFLFDNLRAAG